MKILKIDGGLGFRDIECFNQVMLAKKGWRFLTSTSSQVAHVIKDKLKKGFL